MNALTNAVITITAIETKLTTTGKTLLKIKDQNNKSYQLWKTKFDNSESVAYQRLQELGDPVGQTVEVSIKEEQSEYEGKPITYRTIVNIKATNQRAQTKSNLIVKAQMVEASQKSQDEKWQEISKGKVRHGVACEFIRLGAEYNPATISKINKWVEFIMSGDIFNDAVEAEEDKDFPKEEEINVSKIPF